MSRSAVLLAFVLVALSAPVAAEEEEGVALDRFFRGRVTAFDRGVVTLRYDFSDEKQKEDWYETLPFKIRKLRDQGTSVQEESLLLRGNTGVQHIADWKGDVAVACTLVPAKERDFGGFLAPNTEAPDFATFTLAEHYFHKWDGQDGGQNSIIKFGKQFRKRGFGADFTGFRYVARRPSPKPVVPERTLRLSFGLRRSKLVMSAQGLELKGKDLGVKLKVHRPGLYVLRGALRIDDVEITGRLDEAWLRSVGVEARLATPIAED